MGQGRKWVWSEKMISFAQKCGGSVVFENTYGFKVVVTLPLYPERLLPAQ